MPNEGNLKPFGSGKLSPEEEHEIRSLGGKATGEIKRQKKYSQKLKEEFQQLLDMPCQKGDIEKIETLEDTDKNTSVVIKLFMKLILDYMKTGSPRLLEMIMRYSGGTEDIISDDGDDYGETLADALNKQAASVWDDEKKE